MRSIIFIPGILGSRLDLSGVEVWPPDVLEHISHYKRIDKLLNANVRATAVLGKTYGVPIYDPIMRELDRIAQFLNATRENFFYDWRIDNEVTADRLSVKVASVVRGGATSVTLACHSMGGLVARLLFESRKYNSQSWFRKIDFLVAMCTPHLGAPVALGRALGVEGKDNSLRPQEQRILANDPRYPSAFQCFPVANRAVLYDESVRPPAKLDIYSATVGTRYGLNRRNQQKATATWNSLSIANNKPHHVRYVFLNGSGHTTSDQYFFSGTVFRRIGTTPSGDGTVPSWSSSPGLVEQYSFPGSHLDVLDTPAFKKKLRELFGLTFMTREHSTVSLSLAKRSFEPEEEMEILVIPELASSRIVGRLRVSMARPADGSVSELSSVLLPTGVEVSVNYEGGAAAYIPMKLTAPSVEGLYVLSFESPTHGGEEGPKLAFYVTQRDEVPLQVAPRVATR